jgi:hypothetical protein
MGGGPGNTDAQGVPRILLPGFFLLTFAFTWIAWLASAALAGLSGRRAAWSPV